MCNALDVYSRLKPSTRYPSEKSDSRSVEVNVQADNVATVCDVIHYRTVQMVGSSYSSRNSPSDSWKGRHSATYSKRLV